MYDGGKFHPPHNTIIKLIKTSVNVATLWRQYLRSLITFILGKLNNFKTLFPASSVDRYLVTAFYQKMKKKPWKVLLTSAGVTHNLKKCEHVVRDNILIRRSFSIKKRPTLKHNQDKPTSMFNRTPGGGGVLLMMAYTGRLRPKGLPSFFRLQVYERVGASPRKHLLTTPPPPG